MELKLKRGDDITYILTTKDQDGVVVNITNFNITFSVKRRVSDSTYTIQKTVGNGIVKTNAVNGEFEVTILHVDTNTLKTGKYVYDVELEDSGKYYTPVVDNFIIEPEVTRTVWYCGRVL